MTTIRDVAERAGVSTATVSRVINGSDSVALETRTKVLKTIDTLNYEPSRLARRMRSGIASVLGVVVSDISNPFFASVVRGVESIAYRSQYGIILCNSDEDKEREEYYLRLLQAEKVAGVIVAPADEQNNLCGYLLEDGIAVVAIDRQLAHLDVDTVLVDNYSGAYQAITHLINLGHRRIGFIGGPPQLITGRERQRGYTQALADNQIGVNNALIRIGDFRQPSGHKQAEALMNLETPPTALFVANNLMTLGALNAIHERGLTIPDDISIVGVDDFPWSESLNPPLTVVAQPATEMGMTACQLLLNRINQRDIPTHAVRISPTFVIRSSTSPGKHT